MQRFDVLWQRTVGRRTEAFHAELARYPWTSLDARRYPPELVLRARRGWTENAFNEHCTFLAMGALLEALAAAGAPLDLCVLASEFPRQELLHVALCARVAERLGGLYPMEYEPADVLPSLAPQLSPQQRLAELVVRVCCVGEAFSLPMLAGAMRGAASPLTRAVLETIVEDEAAHGRLGFACLEWLDGELSDADRRRLGAVASATLRQYAPLWEGLTSRLVDGVTSEGFLLEHVHELGWIESGEYRRLALETVEHAIRVPLSRFGIVVT
jgi:hypothetical protein